MWVRNNTPPQAMSASLKQHISPGHECESEITHLPTPWVQVRNNTCPHAITKTYLARVRATFRRRGSFRKPMPWCSLERTQDRMMKSFSRPWKASTLATSISCQNHSNSVFTFLWKSTVLQIKVGTRRFVSLLNQALQLHSSHEHHKIMCFGSASTNVWTLVHGH